MGHRYSLRRRRWSRFARNHDDRPDVYGGFHILGRYDVLCTDHDDERFHDDGSVDNNRPGDHDDRWVDDHDADHEHCTDDDVYADDHHRRYNDVNADDHHRPDDHDRTDHHHFRDDNVRINDDYDHVGIHDLNDDLGRRVICQRADGVAASLQRMSHVNAH